MTAAALGSVQRAQAAPWPPSGAAGQRIAGASVGSHCGVSGAFHTQKCTDSAARALLSGTRAIANPTSDPPTCLAGRTSLFGRAQKVDPIADSDVGCHILLPANRGGGDQLIQASDVDLLAAAEQTRHAAPGLACPSGLPAWGARGPRQCSPEKQSQLPWAPSCAPAAVALAGTIVVRPASSEEWEGLPAVVRLRGSWSPGDLRFGSPAGLAALAVSCAFPRQSCKYPAASLAGAVDAGK